MIRVGLVFVAALGLTVQQKPADTARVAALRFALHNEMPLSEGIRAIVIDTDTPLHDTDRVVRPANLSNAQESLLLARELNLSGRVAGKSALLRCFQTTCVPVEHESVVQVNDAERSTSGVSADIAVWAPSDKPLEYDGIVSRAVIELVERDGGWVGVRYTWGPKTTPVKLPKKK